MTTNEGHHQGLSKLLARAYLRAGNLPLAMDGKRGRESFTLNINDSRPLLSVVPFCPCVRTDPRSRYGRKSWFFSQVAWLLHPVAWLLHPVAWLLHPEGADSTGPPRVRYGVPLPPRIVPWFGVWWAPPQ